MARENNFLLGRGERLTEPVEVPSGGGDKNPPYDFNSARTRVAQRLVVAGGAMRSMPRDACPRGEAVAILTMHPRYISKSDFPNELLIAAGVRAVGSRSRSITPERWGVQIHPVRAVTEEIFIAGPRDSFTRWAAQVGAWTEQTRGARHLTHVEDLAAFTAPEKLRSIPTDRDEVLLEVVLHNADDEGIVEAFEAYAERHGARPLMGRLRRVQGLGFVPVRVAAETVGELAAFTFVRVARGMPSLRPCEPGVLRVTGGFPVNLPTEGPIDDEVRAVVFDGGLPRSERARLAPWVTYVEPAGIGPAVPQYEAHGLGVTAALAFGPLSKAGRLPRPLCRIDHVRILDDGTGTSPSDLECVDALDRILGFLDAHPSEYGYANISVGPNIAVADDEVTLWTASLDERFAHGAVLATIAAGNDGELDAESGANRVQPPADGVNVLAVGASHRPGAAWQRAAYSCVGPGRSPGVVKPDGVAFGGSDEEPFMVLGPGLRARGVQGTSFASPFALRNALSARVQIGSDLAPLTARALLIHRADPAKHPQPHVGWGRFESDSSMLVTCDDDEAVVVFQGELPVKEHLRAPIPLPKVALAGKVTLSATLLIAPEVDPGYPGVYTRSGLEVSFRPHRDKFKRYDDGSTSAHPKTDSFFSAAHLYGVPEYETREDGHKWEPVLRSSRTFLASSLKEPCFDIYYHHRSKGTAAAEQHPIPYALVVSVKAPKVADLYNQVVRAYANILVPMRPRVRIPLSA